MTSSSEEGFSDDTSDPSTLILKIVYILITTVSTIFSTAISRLVSKSS
jgi:hypothetical protein